MKLIICTGIVTNEPAFQESTGSGATCKFNVGVGAGEARSDLWLHCTAQGRRAERAQLVEKGDIITVYGRPMGTGNGRENNAIFVTVEEVIVHAELDAAGSNEPEDNSLQVENVS